MDVHRANGNESSQRWNAVFSALSREPRRKVISSLLDADADEAVPLPESAMVPNAPREPRELRLELQHRHLPKLAEMGFITWESEPLRARRGPQFEQVEVVFHALRAEAATLPDALVIGCRRLEEEREQRAD